ncbi:L,D-transpeptidase [Streptomyces beigongshangae]|uniref:L,D-transpeptidase n=1 Tax=Streptomyces beigongshangae TaxID=2841597 RepID=UPI0021A973F3|nr:L,D-transpeptidase [Streptomyces sp. REN17]
MGTRTHFVPVLLAATLVGGLGAVTTAPAQARPTAAAHYLKFDKSSNTNSSLALMKSVAGPDKVIKKYRAGSGVTKNECTRLKGWLPTKSYTIKKWHTKYNGGLIKGYAFHLNDTKCKDGRTPRTELFIHSEMTRNGGEGTSEATRWDGTGDYKSAGCIKLKPADIKDLYKRGKALGFPKKLVVTN